MNKADRSNFGNAVRSGDLELVKRLLLKYPDYPLVDKSGDTKLHDAAWYGQIEVAEYFIARGCDINAQIMPEGSTPLTHSISGIRTEVANLAKCLAMTEWLLAKGADPNLDRLLISAIQFDVPEYRIRFVRLLVEYGVDVNLCFKSFNNDREMFTALDRALAYDEPEIVEYLLAHGAKPAHEIVGVDRSLYPPVAKTSQSDGVVAHFAGKYGEVEPNALIEIVPDGLPIAIHVIHPSDSNKPLVLFTNGMSAEAMATPAIEGAEKYRFAELFIELPSNWAYKELKNPKWKWPIEILRTLAKRPHVAGTWIQPPAEIIANGDPAKPIAPNTSQDGFLVLQDSSFTDESGKTVWIYQIFPLYREERELATQNGVDALCRILDRNKIDFKFKPTRKNVAESK